MQRLFFTCFKKSLQIIKAEPVILLFFVGFHISLFLITQLFFKDNTSIFSTNIVALSLSGWLMPTLIIQPLILIIAKFIFFKQNKSSVDIINQLIQSISPFFLISLIYKPLFIYGVYKIMTIITTQTSQSKLNIMDSTTGLICIGFATLLNFLLLYAKPMIITSSSQKPLVVIIQDSVTTLLKFKWLSLYCIIMYYLVIYFIQILLMGIIAGVLPSYLHPIFIGILSGIEQTIHIIFVLRLWLYIRPLGSGIAIR
tara:strand:- start:40 stop:804 length:765 start_codon:yes stop_codon:yes gene_type:complete